MTKDGVLKLGDMNVSEISKGLMNIQVGTPYYCSPEIWKNKTYDFKSDIWSLGIMIYELAALRTPFKADNITALSK